MKAYWHHLSSGISADKYNSVEFQIHQLAQFISLTGINMVKSRSDDSHTNIGWNPLTTELYGHSFKSGKSHFRVVFDVGAYKYKIITDKETPLYEFEMANKSLAELADWWKKVMEEIKPGAKIVEKLHYELPDYRIHTATIIIKPEREIIDQWAMLRTHASLVLGDLKLLLDVDDDIRIWPHHFDTGLYVSFSGVDSNETKAIGLGLAIADTMVGEPYFYIYGWAKDEEINYNDRPKLSNGRWITGNWNGAVLPYGEIVSDRGQHGMVSRFFADTVSWYRRTFNLL